MSQTMQNKLIEIENEIDACKPFAKKVAEMRIPLTDTNPVNQGYIDRAKRFCELVAKRDLLEAM